MNMTTPLTEMVNTRDIIEALRALNIKESRPDSDYYVAKILQVSPGTVGNYLSKNKVMAEDIAIRASELLDWPTDLVLMCLAVERARKSNSENVAKVWTESVREKLPKQANALLAGTTIAVYFTFDGALLQTAFSFFG